eukprot:s3102_g1.t4
MSDVKWPLRAVVMLSLVMPIPSAQMPTHFKQRSEPLVSEAGIFGVRWLQLVGLLHCVQEYGIDFSTTVGASMVPVFNASGDVLLYERLTQRLAGWSRGEVVVATSPKDPDGRICKRILGLQGDRVKVWSHIGQKEVLIPRGHVWLEGDNKAASHDSRHYGPVPVGLLQGKVRLKLHAEGCAKMQWLCKLKVMRAMRRKSTLSDEKQVRGKLLHMSGTHAKRIRSTHRIQVPLYSSLIGRCL